MIITKEKFLLKFIIAFNKTEKDKTSSSKDFWKSKGFTGQFLYYLRNILIHETIDFSTLKNVEKTFGYQKILNMFENIEGTISESDKLTCIKYISDNYELYFKSRGYNRIDNDGYHFYQKETRISGLNTIVFIYENSGTKAGFMTIGVHSYNHESGKKNQVMSEGKPLKIYVRAEASGYIMINYYELDNDTPITLEFNQNEDWYKLVIPSLEKYDDIRKKLNLDKNIGIELTKAEFNQKLNELYSDKSTVLRKVIHEIKVGFKDVKNDLADINIV